MGKISEINNYQGVWGMKYALLVCSIFVVYCFAQIKENPITSPILKAYTGDTVDVKVLQPAVPARMVPKEGSARIDVKIGQNDWVGYIVYHKPAGRPVQAVDSVKYKLVNADSANIFIKMRMNFIRPEIDTLP